MFIFKLILGRLLWVDFSQPHNISGSKMSACLYVCPSVRPQKVSSITMKFGM